MCKGPEVEPTGHILETRKPKWLCCPEHGSSALSSDTRSPGLWPEPPTMARVAKAMDTCRASVRHHPSTPFLT